MSLLDLFRRPRRPAASAATAKERLQIVLAHERAGRDSPDYLPLLKRDILAAVEKYTSVDMSKVEVRIQRGIDVSSLEVNVELPGSRPTPRIGNAQPATT